MVVFVSYGCINYFQNGLVKKWKYHGVLKWQRKVYIKCNHIYVRMEDDWLLIVVKISEKCKYIVHNYTGIGQNKTIYYQILRIKMIFLF